MSKVKKVYRVPGSRDLLTQPPLTNGLEITIIGNEPPTYKVLIPESVEDLDNEVWTQVYKATHGFGLPFALHEFLKATWDKNPTTLTQEFLEGFLDDSKLYDFPFEDGKPLAEVTQYVLNEDGWDTRTAHFTEVMVNSRQLAFVEHVLAQGHESLARVFWTHGRVGNLATIFERAKEQPVTIKEVEGYYNVDIYRDHFSSEVVQTLYFRNRAEVYRFLESWAFSKNPKVVRNHVLSRLPLEGETDEDRRKGFWEYLKQYAEGA